MLSSRVAAVGLLGMGENSPASVVPVPNKYAQYDTAGGFIILLVVVQSVAGGIIPSKWFATRPKPARRHGHKTINNK